MNFYIITKLLKKLVLIFLTIFIVLNIISFLLLKSFYKVNLLDYENFLKEKKKYLKETSNSSIPHPFIGNLVLSDEIFSNEFNSEPLFSKISKYEVNDPIKILIVGGSVAEHFSNRGLNYDEDLFFLNVNKKFNTNRFEVYNAAFGGGKQPQQYYKMLYLDLLGFKPDIVINIDGFNEIVLPIHDNVAINNPAIYPRSYSLHLNATAADRSCAKANNKLINKETRIPIIEFFSWAYITRCHKKIIYNNNDDWWTNILKKNYDYSNEDYPRISKEIWVRSSNKMQEFTDLHEISYIQILQPNQYLKGSKKLSKKEIKDFINFRPYGDLLAKHYHLLKFEDTFVKNRIDMRYIFKNDEKTAYADNCCHLNRYGMEKIINKIFEDYESVFYDKLK